jgi:nucleoside-diphosphate-sugar epimerase
VKDVANALFEGSISLGSFEPMNIASGIGITIRELAEFFSSIKNSPIIHEAPQPGDIRISIGNPSRIQSKLNWKPTITLKQGVEEDFQIL